MLRTVLISFAAIVLLTGSAQQPGSVTEAGNARLLRTATNETGTVSQPLATGDTLKAPADAASKPPAESVQSAPTAATPTLAPGNLTGAPGDVMVAPVKRVMPKPFAEKPPVKDAKAETGAKSVAIPAKTGTPATKPAGKIKPKAASAKEPSRKKLSRN